MQQNPLASTLCLVDLPVELLHLIGNYLRPSSIAALAMTSHQMLHIIGKDWITTLANDKDSRMAFLELCQQSAPRRYLCHVCAKFHPLLRNQQDGELEFVKPCAKARFRGLISKEDAHEMTYARQEVRFTDVQLAMDRHFFGPAHGVSLSALWDIRRVGENGKNGVRHVKVREARIADEELILKTSHLFRFRLSEKSTGSIADIMKEIQRRDISICPHLSTSIFSRIPEPTLPEDRLSRTVVVLANDQHCQFCALEYLLYIWKFTEGSSWELVLKGWQDVGSGRSPRDPKWRSCCDGRVYNKDKYWPIPERWHQGSVRDRFNSAPSTAKSDREWNAYWEKYHQQCFGTCEDRIRAPRTLLGVLYGTGCYGIQYLGKYYYDARSYNHYCDRDRAHREREKIGTGMFGGQRLRHFWCGPIKSGVYAITSWFT